MRILPLVLVFASMVRPGVAADWNAAVLAALREMPAGGGYAATGAASARLRSAAEIEAGNLRVRPALARPSYCSGATYLVLLKTVERAQSAGALRIDAASLMALEPDGQRDGEGVWGRWNANGPGTARLFSELGMGRNFTDWNAARPGDFLKIFWRDAVGSNEHGHSVIFLGIEDRGGAEFVRYWSSNQPDGFGEKSVPKSKIARALFSRLERPERLADAGRLPRVDAYLASLLERESSFAEACRLTGAQ
ncbi:MAG: hypothetical protein PHC88_14170 [Terrimicrobiaceae bacterium]|nr:hypothetical protein [Terrimicrobiaceae bacterium]